MHFVKNQEVTSSEILGRIIFQIDVWVQSVHLSFGSSAAPDSLVPVKLGVVGVLAACPLALSVGPLANVAHLCSARASHVVAASITHEGLATFVALPDQGL